LLVIFPPKALTKEINLQRIGLKCVTVRLSLRWPPKLLL
jgi:hypothetical protein